MTLIVDMHAPIFVGIELKLYAAIGPDIWQAAQYEFFDGEFTNGIAGMTDALAVPINGDLQEDWL